LSYPLPCHALHITYLLKRQFLRSADPETQPDDLRRDSANLVYNRINLRLLFHVRENSFRIGAGQTL
jgi:hypothetical protein